MKKLAFVLSGGGSRGALQVGALRALLEAGYQPDLLVGTSIGAVNASYLAVNGVSLTSVEALQEAWYDAIDADLLPSNYLSMAVRTLVSFSLDTVYDYNRDFYISHGLPPDYRFGDIQDVELILVATDLNSGEAVLYGRDAEQHILDGLMASITLPPWMLPKQHDGQQLMDGGVVSNLPIEPALTCGATEIIALDLLELREPRDATSGFGRFLNKLIFTVSKRQVEMELALAESRQVPVRRVNLVGKEPIALWDFQHTPALIEQGYEITKEQISIWEKERQPFWQRWLKLLRERG
jgi:NTE family protein